MIAGFILTSPRLTAASASRHGKAAVSLSGAVLPQQAQGVYGLLWTPADPTSSVCTYSFHGTSRLLKMPVFVAGDRDFLHSVAAIGVVTLKTAAPESDDDDDEGSSSAGSVAASSSESGGGEECSDDDDDDFDS